MRRPVLAALFAALALVSATSATADTQVLASASFETSLDGWGPWNATVSRQAVAASGAYSARVVAKKNAKSFSIGPDAAPVASSVAGATYSAAAAVRTDKPGRDICIRIREYAGTTVAASALSCVIGATTWTRVGVSHVATAAARKLDYYVYVRTAVRSDSFNVDDASFSVVTAAPAPAPSPTPTPPPAPLVAPTAVGATGIGETALTLVWTAAADARVTGYRISQNGATLGQTGGTSFAVAGLACGTAYTFGVRSLDAAGAASDEVTAVVGSAACPPPPVVSACTKYASLTGNDAGDGSAAAPYRTAQKLVSSLTAGQTGCLQPGTYAEAVTVSTGGAPGAPITLTSATSTRATILGRLYVRDSANDVVVSNLVLNGKNSGSQPSPTVNGDRIVFRDNDVTNDQSEICFVIGSSLGYGIAYDVVIDRNRIHNCGALPSTNRDHAIYVESSRNLKVTNNVIYDNADRGVQLYPDSQGTLVANNVIDGNGEGIIFSGEDGMASNNNVVVDNVITNSNIRYNVESYWPAGNPIGVGNLAHLNCVWNGRQGNFDGGAGYTQVNNLIVDPQYVNRAAKDFRLSAGSPCAGKGPQP